MKGWWYRASQEQKLAQVDAGIELGLTAGQVAMVSGVEARRPADTINNFAHYHGRRFPDVQRTRRGIKSENTRLGGERARRAYFEGDGKEVFWRDDPRSAPRDQFGEIILE